jgi:septum formation protein
MSAITLASASPHRKALLEKIDLKFSVCPSHVDEQILSAETYRERAIRLAREKSQALGRCEHLGIVIGSDQVAADQQGILRKPCSIEQGILQLERISGQSLDFFTALACFDVKSGVLLEHCDHTRIWMHSFSTQEASEYLQREPDAVYCAGSLKSESLGMLLIERVETHDPTALVGLPMLTLINFLRRFKVPLL